VDANHDGRSYVDVNANGSYEAGVDQTELRTLAELGVLSISLSGTSQSGLMQNGNEVLATSTFTQNVDASGQGVALGTPGSSTVTREALAANFLHDPSGHTFTASGTGFVTITEGGASTYAALSAAGELIDVTTKGVGTMAGVDNATGAEGNDTLIGNDARALSRRSATMVIP
jgi:hypothetical protein